MYYKQGVISISQILNIQWLTSLFENSRYNFPSFSTNNKNKT